VNQVHSLQAELEGAALFLTIYIAEAHAQDQWPLGQHVSVLQHKTVEERRTIANKFCAKVDYKIHMVVDDISNNFMNIYWAHPERFFIVNDGKLALKAQPTDDGWFLYDDIRNWIKEHRS